MVTHGSRLARWGRLGTLLFVPLAGAGCKRASDPAAAATVTNAPIDEGDGPTVDLSKTSKLLATAMQVNVYAKPADNSKKIGYLRLGAQVLRSEKSHGTEGCPGGWYGVAPRGFVCVGKTASLETDSPLAKAASVRPDTRKPLPYAYGFVRSVAPLYLRLPSREEAQSAEFKLAEHLGWWGRHGKEANQTAVGANDVAREIIPDAPAQARSDSLGDGVLLGGRTDADPPPFWLETGQRKIPNVSGFEVPAASYFANRVRRHTGIAFVGSFDAGQAFDHRRFALTVDMRLIPVDKLKPETGSPFHGVELGGDIKLPVAYAKPCDRNAKGTPRPCVHPYVDDGVTLKRMPETLATRAFIQLTGVQRKAHGTRYLQTKSGTWVRASDVGVSVVPQEWPMAAQRGEKWVDVAIEDQTLTLWEGTKPVFVTLVSTGQDGLDDPKKSKSTPRGTYRIKSKHITTTMDSNERSAQSGGAAPDPKAGEAPTADDKHSGQFELRDVPYVQYFQDGYALHSAYWHDHFGMARSHGCINLAPVDALRVFRFTDPPVPDGWHGVQGEGKGSSVIIHR